LKRLSDIQRLKKQGVKIACLTAYDAGFSALLDACGVDVILVGDSLGMVVQGHHSTVPVTLNDMIYHAQMVRRGAPKAWVVADLPFMTCATLEQGLFAAQSLMQQAQVQMVKIEGGHAVVPLVAALAQQGVPVCAHLGLLPQQSLRLGYQTAGKTEADADRLFEEALALEAAGASMLVLECVVPSVSERISRALSIPTIGIGSGVNTDGQVLVLTDVLGLTPNAPSFAPSFLVDGRDLKGAVDAYVLAVKAAQFPTMDNV
jgi:3-methyl-2-oxobutanoate hydroxymethyltransferase